MTWIYVTKWVATHGVVRVDAETLKGVETKFRHLSLVNAMNHAEKIKQEEIKLLENRLQKLRELDLSQPVVLRRGRGK